MRSTTSNTASSTSSTGSVTGPIVGHGSTATTVVRLAAEPRQQPLLGRRGRGDVQRRVEHPAYTVVRQPLGVDQARGDQLAVQFGVPAGGVREVPRVHGEVGGHLLDVLGRV